MKDFFSLNHPIGNRLIFLIVSVLFVLGMLAIFPVWFETWMIIVFLVMVVLTNIWYSYMIYRVMKEINNG